AEAKRRALSEGATDFLNKPLDTTEVLLRIRNLLHARALHLALQNENEMLEQRVQARTRELEGAKAEILGLYRELARAYQEQKELLRRPAPGGDDQRGADAAARDRAGAEAVEKLTPREQDVLRLVAEGQTNAEIAHNL